MRREQKFIDGVTKEPRTYVTEGYVMECWFDGTCDRDETHTEALKSVARWVMRDDLSVERRLAAIRRVAHEALSSDPA